MGKRSLKNLNPLEVASLETQMWKAYYSHKFIKLFLLMLRLIHKLFGLSYFMSLYAAFFSSYAAFQFRFHKGRETKKVRQRIKKYLTKFYKIIARHAQESFDYKEAAEKELHWWFVDRYPDRYEITRRDALAEHMACMYNISSDILKEYADYRASAMELCDILTDTYVEVVDWNEVGELLHNSYKSLYGEINK